MIGAAIAFWVCGIAIAYSEVMRLDVNRTGGYITLAALFCSGWVIKDLIEWAIK